MGRGRIWKSFGDLHKSWEKADKKQATASSKPRQSRGIPEELCRLSRACLMLKKKNISGSLIGTECLKGLRLDGTVPKGLYSVANTGPDSGFH